MLFSVCVQCIANVTITERREAYTLVHVQVGITLVSVFFFLDVHDMIPVI